MTDTNISLLELSKALISKASITPEDAGCQEIIKSILDNIGFDCKALPFAGVSNLWAKIGNNRPLFVFAGHTDVVPSGPLSLWTSPPFDPEIKENMLYGRGTSDMKCALAAMVKAAERYLLSRNVNKELLNFKGSIAFLITSDEEGPADYGTKKVLDYLKDHNEVIDYCILGEPSSEAHVGDQIRIGRRGSLHGKLVIIGKQGHVAHPHLAMNAIHHSLASLLELTQLSFDEGNDQFPPTTFQITNIHAGTGALNVIPAKLEVDFNLRFGTIKTIDELKYQIEAILIKNKINYELTWNLGASPFLNKTGKLINYTKTAIHKITGKHTKLSTGGGTSDGRFIAATGAEIVELGLSHLTAHHANECVSIDELMKLEQIYFEILSQVFA